MGEQWLFMISHEKSRWNGPHRNAFHLLGQRLAAPASSATLVLIKTIIKKQLCILTNDVFPLSLCPFLPGLGFFSFSFFFSADLHSTYFCAFLRLRLLAVSACSVVVCLGSEHHSWLYQHMTSKWQHAVFKTLWRTHTVFHFVPPWPTAVFFLTRTLCPSVILFSFLPSSSVSLLCPYPRHYNH